MDTKAFVYYESITGLSIYSGPAERQVDSETPLASKDLLPVQAWFLPHFYHRIAQTTGKTREQEELN